MVTRTESREREGGGGRGVETGKEEAVRGEMGGLGNRAGVEGGEGGGGGCTNRGRGTTSPQCRDDGGRQPFDRGRK